MMFARRATAGPAACVALAAAAASPTPSEPAGARLPVPLVSERHCDAVALEAISSYFDAPAQIVVHFKEQPRLLLGAGLADLNADCTAFWWSHGGGERQGPVISLVSASGALGDPFPGHDPRWLPDSSALVYTVGNRFQLMIRKSDGSSARTLFKPADATACIQLSDGPSWMPPIAIDDHVVSWTYATTPRVSDPLSDGGKPAATVRVDVRTGRVLERTASTLECDYV